MGSPEKVLARIKGFEAAVIERTLRDGIAHRSYLVLRDTQRFVLRLDKPAADTLGLHREREYRLAARVSDAGLCPPWIEWSVEQGWGLRRWWPGRSWQTRDLAAPGAIAVLAELLRDLHRVPARDATGDVQDRVAPLMRYAEQLDNEQAADLSLEGREAIAALAEFDAPPVICHNDLVCHNLVQADTGMPSGRALFLIDLEFAALGDAYFDLATVLEHHAMRETWSRALLACYLEREASPREWRRLELWRRYYRCLLRLWTLRIDHLA